jgi:uncharacterized protein YkwD
MVEELEARQMLTGGFEPTALEQEFLERLNDARANPTAYGRVIGVDLSYVAPSQPLTFDMLLIQAARMHSQDMNDQNYFSHNSPQGQTPGDRLTGVGFPWTSWGESISAGYATVEEALAGLIIDAGVPGFGHRNQLLAIDSISKTQTQVGIGVVMGGSGTYHNYFTIDTASTADTRPFLTGVVFNDTSGTGIYQAGEGLGNVTITVSGIGSFQNWASGGYSLRVNPGSYTVTASGGGLASPITTTVTVGSSSYRLNFTPQSNSQGGGTNMTPTLAVADASGGQMMFVLGTDNQVWVQRFNSAGNSLGGYYLGAAGTVQQMAAGRDGNGNPELFVIGLDNQVYRERFDANDNPIGGYGLTRAGQVKSISVGHDAANHPELFVIGMDNQVWGQKFDFSGNSISGYFLTQVGGVLTLSVGQDASGYPLLFVLGLDSQVYAQKMDANGNSASGWARTAAGNVKSFQVGHDASGRPELFAIGLDSQVYSQKFDNVGNPLTGWQLTSVGRVNGITLGFDGHNDPELFVMGMDNVVYRQKFDASGNSVSGYSAVSSGVVKSLTLGRDSSGNPELFVIGTDNQVWGMNFNGSGDPISGYFLTAPGTVQ